MHLALMIALTAAAQAGPGPKLLDGHTTGLVRTVAFLPDGRQLLSIADDGRLLLWALAEGSSRTLLQRESWGARGLALSRDGRVVAVAGPRGGISFLELSTRQEREAVAAYSTAFALSPDGALLAGVSGTRVLLRAADTGRLVRALDGELTYSVAGLVWSPDGTRIVATVNSGDGVPLLWEAATGRKVELAKPLTDAFEVAFSPDGKLLAVAKQDIRLIDVATGRELRRLSAHRGMVYALAFSSDGGLLASGAGDKTVRVWDVATGATVASLDGHADAVSAVAFSPDDRLVASGSFDGSIRLWTLAEHRRAAPPATPPAAVSKPGLQPGFMVIADGGATRDEGEAKLAAYEQSGYPANGKYPRLVDSSTVVGLKPGFWIVVAGVARDEAVAKALDAFLRHRGLGSYVRMVEVEAPDDLRLLVVGRSQVACQEEGYPKLKGRTRSLQLLSEEPCHGECGGSGAEPFSSSRVGKGGRVALLYTADQVPADGRLFLDCERERGDFPDQPFATLVDARGNSGMGSGTYATFAATQRGVTEVASIRCGCFFP
jgi:Tol biopolymer transport system component